MTRKAQRSVRVRKATAGPTAAVVGGLALLIGAAAPGQATTAAAAAGARSAPSCGAAATAPMTAATRLNAASRAETAPGTGLTDTPAPAVTGTAAQQLAYSLAPEAPIGLWASSNLTLRTPVSKGTVRLDVTTQGFIAASLLMQRYDEKSHRWVDLDVQPTGSEQPDKGAFSFPLSVTASPDRPATVALRVQAIDRPGRLAVTASVNDGHGHTYRAPTRNTVVDRPTTAVTGWPHGASLVRGGAAKEFELTVKNTTKRAYPALNAEYFAYGQSDGRALAPKDLVLQQYVPGQGWQRVSLVPGGCDPGMGAELIPTAKKQLAPGATAVYRMRLAVVGGAPLVNVEAGVSVGAGNTSFSYQNLPFTIRAK
ncbi:membrane protein [Streptomyces noursei ATCC 11455]|nr:membrane protein [Streptomyces noursei ATCC 11455]